jgi:large subunit ribosomal protein L14
LCIQYLVKIGYIGFFWSIIRIHFLCIITCTSTEYENINKMLQKESKLRIFDNTGARTVKCINVRQKKKRAFIGDLITIVITKFKAKKKLIKKQLYYGLVVCTNFFLYRPDGIRLKTDSNRIFILNKGSKLFLGTRVYGPVYREIRQIVDGKKKLLRYEKIVSLAKKTI